MLIVSLQPEPCVAYIYMYMYMQTYHILMSRFTQLQHATVACTSNYIRITYVRNIRYSTLRYTQASYRMLQLRVRQLYSSQHATITSASTIRGIDYRAINAISH